jgi:putative heme iron utilization protein
MLWNARVIATWLVIADGAPLGVACKERKNIVDEPLREAARLVAGQRWFALATVDANGSPTVSYLPFAFAGAAFGIVASRLAAHTANLTARRPASILIVAEDAEQRDAYARARLTIAVDASAPAPGSVPANAVWSGLEARQGATVRTLRTLPDFTAIVLEPAAGRFVAGFAAAFDFDRAQLAEMLRAQSDGTVISE